MRDCPNVMMRERLPDLLHGLLPAAERAEVHAHLNECAECRAELQVLERVRAAAPVISIDQQRIAAALPPYRPVPAWRKLVASPALRIAAALLLVTGTGLLLATRGGTDDQVPVGTTVATSTPRDSLVDSPDTSRVTPQRRRQSEPPATELAVGETLHDLSDAELKSLLDAFGSLEAVTPIETEVVVPAVSRGGA